MRISDYFEMSAYNSVVKHYGNNGYIARPTNLIKGTFRYKLSPTGYPENFSHFEVVKTYTSRKGNIKKFTFEIHHNLAVASSISKGLYVTPDIAVIKQNSIQRLNDRRYFFSGKRVYCYVENNALQTFCEVKNLNPFPELLFNYIGLLNEIKNDVFQKNHSVKRPKHIAPSLMLSGGGNYHVNRIRKALTRRYAINIFFGLFYRPSQPYSTRYSSNVINIGTSF
jgi:hypothetical protein